MHRGRMMRAPNAGHGRASGEVKKESLWRQVPSTLVPQNRRRSIPREGNRIRGCNCSTRFDAATYVEGALLSISKGAIKNDRYSVCTQPFDGAPLDCASSVLPVP